MTMPQRPYDPFPPAKQWIPVNDAIDTEPAIRPSAWGSRATSKPAVPARRVPGLFEPDEPDPDGDVD
ncbi:hypothetical protein AB0D10_00915 [Kitasatospora sp. NPDC048545]|uniref:hypothetical protein n=1 Tax=Kitasatospora sp. NPDC048545 TaxID=3157208 RepID=UPI0033D0402F